MKGKILTIILSI